MPKDKKMVISPAELKVLDILWENSPLTSSQIVDALGSTESWHSRTIKSLINRLLKKLLIKSIGARWNYYLWFVIFVPWIAVWMPINLFSDTNFNIKLLTTPLDSRQYIQYMSDNLSLSISRIIFVIWILGTIAYSL